MMSRWTKLSIGLLVALAVGWVAYGPAGMGAAYIDRIEASAQVVVREAAIPGVSLRLGRDPLSRTAYLSGPANEFQREGMGLLPGLNDRVGGVPGVAAVSWDGATRGMPLLAEILVLTALAYLIGVGLGWVFFRPKRVGFL